MLSLCAIVLSLIAIVGCDGGGTLVALSGKGVRSLKAFLEYAERGREMLAVDYRNAGEKKKGIGEYIAADLAASCGLIIPTVDGKYTV